MDSMLNELKDLQLGESCPTAPTWTQSICKRMFFWALFRGVWAIIFKILHILGVQVDGPFAAADRWEAFRGQGRRLPAPPSIGPLSSGLY